MATWSITPTAATITSSGVATFPQNNGNSDVEYTITYTDNDGCSGTAKYTIPKRSCSLTVQGPPNRIFTFTGTSCNMTGTIYVNSTVNNSPAAPTFQRTYGSSDAISTITVTQYSASLYIATFNILKFPVSGTDSIVYTVSNAGGCEQTITIVLYAGSCTGPSVPSTIYDYKGCLSSYINVTPGSCNAEVVSAELESPTNWVTSLSFDSTNSRAVYTLANYDSFYSNNPTRSANIIFTDCLGNTASTTLYQVEHDTFTAAFYVSFTSAPNAQPSTTSASYCYIVLNNTCSKQYTRQQVADEITDDITITYKYRYYTNYPNTIKTYIVTETCTAAQLKNTILNYYVIPQSGSQYQISNNATHNLPQFIDTGNYRYTLEITASNLPRIFFHNNRTQTDSLDCASGGLCPPL